MDYSYRQPIYYPNMDAREPDEKISCEGSFFMTIAEKRLLIKEQIKFLQKDVYKQNEMPMNEFIPANKVSSQEIEESDDFSKSTFNKRGNQHNISMSAKRVPISSGPKILIHLTQDKFSGFERDSISHPILGCSGEFKKLLLLVEEIYLLSFKLSNFLDFNDLISRDFCLKEELQFAIGFKKSHNILPLQILCIKKGNHIINALFHFLDPPNQDQLLLLVIDNISSFYPIYSIIDPSEALISLFLQIIPRQNFSRLCSLNSKLIEYFKEFDDSNLKNSKIFIQMKSSILDEIERYNTCMNANCD